MSTCISAIRSRLGRLQLAVLLAGTLFIGELASGDPVPVHHREGIEHGFLLLRSLDGRILASGDLLQVVDGDRVTSETVFHFKDGSLLDETAQFSQDHTFRLLSDHMIRKGASFRDPIDIYIDASKNQVTVHTSEKGKEKDWTEHMDLPEDIANGMVTTLVKNLSTSTGETKLSMLTPSAKPRLIKLSVKAQGERVFSVAGSARKATNFDIKIEIGGVAGAVAPLLGKQPPDTHIWMSTGMAPTFVRSEGPFYEGGPIWRIDLAPLTVSDHDLRSESSPNKSEKK